MIAYTKTVKMEPNIKVTLNTGDEFEYHYSPEYWDIMVFNFTDGDLGCDCNLNLLMDQYNGCEKPDIDDEDYPCGDSLQVEKIEIIETGEVFWERK